MDNHYGKRVFLSTLLAQPDYRNDRIWSEHQQMQMRFLSSKGMSANSSVLDMGCGPLRLGVALIPKLTNGWYYGVDINENTLQAGRKVLIEHGVSNNRFSLICSDSFDTSEIKGSIDFAFSNSLFSHLSLNSILMCLKKIREVIATNGVYYSTFFMANDDEWLNPISRKKWGREFDTFPNKDPYHYSLNTLDCLADIAGYNMSLVDDFYHPIQTMACFKPI